ncbi:MAG: hypothetical protein A2298_03715 [Gammaproteobacteria bacterium RIFOXYB2_FULL_38_6]|nr:MAG: hypothetical protein A2298_03715 [Gammaproteobacteria bacterium RIFOXYB2_FULL_38_6]
MVRLGRLRFCHKMGKREKGKGRREKFCRGMSMKSVGADLCVCPLEKREKKKGKRGKGEKS